VTLGIEFAPHNNEQAFVYIDSAYRMAYRLGDSAQLVRAGRLKGMLLRRMTRLDESLEALNKVRLIAKRNKLNDEYKRILNALAIGYTYKANYDEALKYNFESLVIREAEGDKAAVSITLNNIGLVYFKLENYDRSIEYYMKSLTLKREVKDSHDLDHLLINMGLCYNQLKNFGEAQHYIHEAFRTCGENCSKDILMEGKFGLGVALLKGYKKTDDAEKDFTESLAIARELQDNRFEAENLVLLARISNLKHDEAAAYKFLKEAESLANTAGYKQVLITLYAEFSTMYNQTKNFELEARYQKKYIDLKDSIFSKELIKNLATVQTNYEQRENIKTIADKDQVLALKEETLLRQKSESLFIIVVSILVFALAILMLMLFRLTQRANSVLEERVEKRTKELNDSNEALAKVNGELDNFIYKTSHDIRGPLASLKGICNVAIMDVHDEAALGYLQKLDITAEKLNRILTRLLIINQINHAVLAANVIVFEEIIEEILFLERKKGIPKRLAITYTIDKGFVLKSDKEMLRIVLENLIDNGIKFYNESERIDPFVKIHVTKVDRVVVIRVIDNGVGINEETKEKIFQMFVRASERSETGGIGLYLARLATGRLEGKIEFRTTAEKFTEFSVKLPLDLGPVLEYRREQERIREFEKHGQIGKENPVIVS
jgi:signal transduction histidine kinase